MAPTLSHPPPGDLADLPRQARLLRWLTALALGATVLTSAWMGFGLRHDALFALASGVPRDLGVLGTLDLPPELRNQWVRGGATLENTSVDYRRPFETASFRLFPVFGKAPLFVQIQVPAAPGTFVMPSSFVGRLLPLDQLGLYHQGLQPALESRFGNRATGAWVLLDGDAPSTSLSALGLCVLCWVFSLFGLVGLLKLFWPSVRVFHETEEVSEA